MILSRYCLRSCSFSARLTGRKDRGVVIFGGGRSTEGVFIL